MRVGISRVHHPVTVLGYGRRVGVWFQGCSIHCPGCVSQDTWGLAEEEQLVDVADVLDVIAGAGPLDGLTVSGGEPFDQPGALAELLGGFRELGWSEADVLIYSGYTTKMLRRRHADVLRLADAVITGPYRASHPGDARMGSGNQQTLLLTGLGRTRYSQPPARPGFQAVAAGGSLWMIGIPESGDMETINQRLEQRGVVLHDVSWRC